MTPYSNVFNRFEKQITDYDLNLLLPASKTEVLIGLLNEAVVEYVVCPISLDKNDTTQQFSNTLTPTVEQVLANYMVMAWIKPYLNNQDLFEVHFSTQEYNEFSPANRMKALSDCFNLAKKQAGSLLTKQSIKDAIGGLG